MSEQPQRFATKEELTNLKDYLKDEFGKRPTTFEMRFWIIAALIAAPSIPAADIARAATGILP